MKRSDWMVPGVLLLSYGAVVCAGAKPSATSQIAERIRIQEARLPQIEALAAQEREQVERWYAVRRAGIVPEIARREAARLTLAQRQLWVQYADLYLDRPRAPADFHVGFALGSRAVFLGKAMIQEYLISEMAEILVDREFERKLAQIVEKRLEAPLLPLLRDRAAELLILVRNARAELAAALRQLESQRDARLDAIMEWEEDLKEQVRGILEYLRQSELRPAPYGVVTSVGYAVNSGYFCTVEGVDKVLRVGDKIGDIRILKIDPEKVEFANDGTTWAQSLGALPQPFWDGEGV